MFFRTSSQHAERTDPAVGAGLPSDDSQTERQSCLHLLDRARKRSSSIDPDWLFGDANIRKTDENGNEEPYGSHADPPSKIGRFEIVRELGRGGYGVVFLAIDPKLNREIALKVPAPDVLLNDELQKRFLREASAAAALKHPQIVAVHETGRSGSVLFIASEYVPGQTLATWLQRHGPTLDAPAAAAFVESLARAVQHAHGRGVLHRDIKPGNVLLEYADSGELAADNLSAAARLSDFGLARIETADFRQGSDVTRESILGTPAYMSPEQAEGRNGDVDATSDVYALGVILYELLVGVTPFKRATSMATLKAIWTEEPIPPSRRVASVPRDLEAICLKALRRDQSARYVTADALADDLQRFLSGESVVARRATRLERMSRWCRRNPIVAGLSAIVTVLVLVIAVGSSVAAIQLNVSRTKALDHLEREIKAKDKATRKEELALRALFEARLAQARAGRNGSVPGRQHESLKAIESAAGLIPRLKLGEKEVRLLRNEAIACMTNFDLAEDKQWPVDRESQSAYATDPDGTRYAYFDQPSATIVVRRIDNNKVVASLRQPVRSGQVRCIEFSPDGKYLACVWDQRRKLPRIQIWNLNTKKTIHVEIISDSRRPFDFSPDGKQIAISRRNGAVEIRELAGLTVVTQLPGKQPTAFLRFRPDGRRLAFARGKLLQIYDLSTRRFIREIECVAAIREFDWSPDGRQLALAVFRWVELRRAATGWRYRTLHHPIEILGLSFHPSRSVLATSAGDGRTRLWDINDGRHLLGVHKDSTGFSRDGRWMGTLGGRWKVIPPPVVRSFRQPRLPGVNISATSNLSVHKGGRLVAASNRAQTVFRDLATGQVVGLLKIENGSGVFSPTGEQFIISSVKGLFQYPVKHKETAMAVHFEIGRPKRIGRGGCGRVVVSNDGAVICCADRYHLRRVALHNASGKSTVEVTPQHAGTKWLDLTGDGRLLATGTWRGRNVRVWNAQNGRMLKAIPAKSACVAFDPRGTMLAIDEGRRFSVWRTKDWTSVLAKQRKPNGGFEPDCLAFSPDGRILAVLDACNVIRLLETRRFTELARLELPFAYVVEAITFSPTGDRLVAASRGSWGALHIWDLLKLRNRLFKLKLDWNRLRPPSRAGESKPVHLSIIAD